MKMARRMAPVIMPPSVVQASQHGLHILELWLNPIVAEHRPRAIVVAAGACLESRRAMLGRAQMVFGENKREQFRRMAPHQVSFDSHESMKLSGVHLQSSVTDSRRVCG